jgi:hypothetical protein
MPQTEIMEEIADRPPQSTWGALTPTGSIFIIWDSVLLPFGFS